ncbi:hypothetical protein GCM10009780_41000 [Actinomadura alba]
MSYATDWVPEADGRCVLWVSGQLEPQVEFVRGVGAVRCRDGDGGVRPVEADHTPPATVDPALNVTPVEVRAAHAFVRRRGSESQMDPLLGGGQAGDPVDRRARRFDLDLAVADRGFAQVSGGASR